MWVLTQENQLIKIGGRQVYVSKAPWRAAIDPPNIEPDYELIGGVVLYRGLKEDVEMAFRLLCRAIAKGEHLVRLTDEQVELWKVRVVEEAAKWPTSGSTPLS